MLGHQKGTKYQGMNNFMQFYLISWFLNVPEIFTHPGSHSLLGSWSLWYLWTGLAGHVKCNIKCRGIKKGSKYQQILAISRHTVSLVQVNSKDIPRYPKIQKYPDNIWRLEVQTSADHQRLAQKNCNITDGDPGSHGLVGIWSLWNLLVASQGATQKLCNIM